MNWIQLDSDIALKKVIESSYTSSNGVVIFKHSTRCSISAVAKTRLSLKWKFNEELPAFYLDLLQYRSLSNLIAENFNVPHESPQILLIKDGKCIYNASHLSISASSIEAALPVKT